VPAASQLPHRSWAGGSRHLKSFILVG